MSIKGSGGGFNKFILQDDEGISIIDITNSNLNQRILNIKGNNNTGVFLNKI